MTESELVQSTETPETADAGYDTSADADGAVREPVYIDRPIQTVGRRRSAS